MKARTAARLCSRPRGGSKSRSGRAWIPSDWGRECSESDGHRSGVAVLPRAKSCPSEGLRKRGVGLPYLFSAGLDGIAVFSLPHISGAQRLLAERMITIVAHFRTQVVKFIFAGRNSGQEQTEAQDGWYSQWPSGSIGLPEKLTPPGTDLVNCCA